MCQIQVILELHHLRGWVQEMRLTIQEVKISAISNRQRRQASTRKPSASNSMESKMCNNLTSMPSIKPILTKLMLKSNKILLGKANWAPIKHSNQWIIHHIIQINSWQMQIKFQNMAGKHSSRNKWSRIKWHTSTSQINLLISTWLKYRRIRCMQVMGAIQCSMRQMGFKGKVQQIFRITVTQAIWALVESRRV